MLQQDEIVGFVERLGDIGWLTGNVLQHLIQNLKPWKKEKKNVAKI
jgi:hypothetical protein